MDTDDAIANFLAFIAVASLVAIVFLSLGIISYEISKYSCYQKGKAMQTESRYSWWGGGCYIKIKGTYYPEDAINHPYGVASQVIGNAMQEDDN
jgi:hypothetical protein